MYSSEKVPERNWSFQKNLQNVNLMWSDKRVFFIAHIHGLGKGDPYEDFCVVCEEETKLRKGENTRRKRTNRSVCVLMNTSERGSKIPVWADQALQLENTLNLVWWSWWTPIPLWSACLPPTQVTLGVLVHPLKLSLHTPDELEQEWGGVSESQKIVNHSWDEGALKMWLISVAGTGKKWLSGCDWQLP